MHTAHRSHRGQVLIIFVFAIVGLIGITGLAIDGGNVYADRRHAQNAADTSALAAAVIRINSQKYIYEHGGNPLDCVYFSTSVHTSPYVYPYTGCASQIINSAKDMASTNGYNDNKIDNEVEVHSPPISGPYKDEFGYIQVVIHSAVNTWFARVLGTPQLHNQVEADALANYSPESNLFGGNSLVSLKPSSESCPGDFTLGGSGSVTLIGGGIYVNSSNPTCAFKETSSCVDLTLSPFTDDAGNVFYPGLTSVGGEFTSSCPEAPTFDHVSPSLPFPPDSPLFCDGVGATQCDPPEQPAECNMAPAAMTTDSNGFSHYYPGHYAMLPPDKNTTLDPGVYCVDTVIKTTNPTTFNVAASSSTPGGTYDIGGAFIYIKPGGSFDFQGGTVKLHAPTSGRYKGYLLYVDSDFSGTSPNCTINGGTDDSFKGVIWAPYCDVQINGNSTEHGYTAQIVGYTITLNGTSSLTFTYDSDDMPKIPETRLTGLAH